MPGPPPAAPAPAPAPTPARPIPPLHLVPNDITPEQVYLTNFTQVMQMDEEQRRQLHVLLQARQVQLEAAGRVRQQTNAERFGGPLVPQDPREETRRAYRMALAGSRLNPHVHVVRRSISLFAQLIGTTEQAVCEGIPEYLLYALYESSEKRNAVALGLGPGPGPGLGPRARQLAARGVPAPAAAAAEAAMEEVVEEVSAADLAVQAAQREIPATPWEFMATFCVPLWAHLNSVHRTYVVTWCGSRAPSPNEMLANEQIWTAFVTAAAAEQNVNRIPTRPAYYTNAAMTYVTERASQAYAVLRDVLEVAGFAPKTPANPTARIHSRGYQFGGARTEVAPRTFGARLLEF